MAARTCLYSDPKKEGEGPRLYLATSGWTENPQLAVEFFSLSSANRPHQVPMGYQQSQPVLAEVIKVHPAVHEAKVLTEELQGLFPRVTITTTVPKEPGLSWIFEVTLPPEKRSLVISYRDRRGYVIKVYRARPVVGAVDLVTTRQELLLKAIQLSEPLTCPCACHGPMVDFFHCFGPECCTEPDAHRSNAIRAERDAQV